MNLDKISYTPPSFTDSYKVQIIAERGSGGNLCTISSVFRRLGLGEIDNNISPT